MLMDLQNLLSDAQTIAAVASTIVSTNSMDLGTAGTVPGTGPSGVAGTVIHDIGRGNTGHLLCQITEAVTSAGAATVQFQLIMSANADLSSPVVLQETIAIGKATLTAGYMARLEIPPGISSRYLGAQYVIGTATTTAGKVTTAIVMDRQTNPIV